jgi:hypothetical protein
MPYPIKKITKASNLAMEASKPWRHGLSGRTVEHLPNKYEMMSSNLSTTKKTKNH